MRPACIIVSQHENYLLEFQIRTFQSKFSSLLGFWVLLEQNWNLSNVSVLGWASTVLNIACWVFIFPLADLKRFYSPIALDFSLALTFSGDRDSVFSSHLHLITQNSFWNMTDTLIFENMYSGVNSTFLIFCNKTGLSWLKRFIFVSVTFYLKLSASFSVFSVFFLLWLRMSLVQSVFYVVKKII